MKFLKNNNNNKILIIRLSSMGDVILASHLVRNLKEQFPLSAIDILTSDQYSEIYENNPYLTKVIKYDKTKNNFEQKLQKKEIFQAQDSNKYDLVIDLQRNFRSKKIYSGESSYVLKVHKNRINKLSMVYFKKFFSGKPRHITEIYMDTVKKLGIVDDGKGLEIWLPEEKESKSYPPENFENEILKQRNKIAIAPGAFHTTKRWLPHRFSRLAEILKEKYNVEIVLIGGPKDNEICNSIISECKIKNLDYSCSASIYESARQIDSCRLVITNDTGVMHISAARKVPVVAIFGSTAPEFGFTPFRINHEIVQIELGCRPCTHYGKDKCPKGHFKCMNLIEVNDVLKAVEKLLN